MRPSRRSILRRSFSFPLATRLAGASSAFSIRLGKRLRIANRSDSGQVAKVLLGDSAKPLNTYNAVTGKDCSNFELSTHGRDKIA